METVAALISQVPSLLLPLALGKGGYGQEARRQTPSGASPGDGVSGGTGAIQAPLPLGGAPGASRALPGPRGARLRLGTDSRRAGLRGADEACPVTRHGLWAGGQEPRWRPGAHPSHRSQRAGEARALVLGAETRSLGQPSGRLRRPRVPKWPRGASPGHPTCPAPRLQRSCRTGPTPRNTPVCVTLSPFVPSKDGDLVAHWCLQLTALSLCPAPQAWCLCSSDSPGLLPGLHSPSCRKHPVGVFVSPASPSPMGSSLRASLPSPRDPHVSWLEVPR